MDDDETQGEAAWRLLNGVTDDTSVVNSRFTADGTQSQLLPGLGSGTTPSAPGEYRAYGLVDGSFDIDSATSQVQEPGNACIAEPNTAPNLVATPRHGESTSSNDVPSGAPPSPSPLPPVPTFKVPAPPSPMVQRMKNSESAVASSSRAKSVVSPRAKLVIARSAAPDGAAPDVKIRPRRAPSPSTPGQSQDSFGIPTGSQNRSAFMAQTGNRLAELLAEAEGEGNSNSSQTQDTSSPDASKIFNRGSKSEPSGGRPVVLVQTTPLQSQDESQRRPERPSQASDVDESGAGGGQDSQTYAQYGAPVISRLDDLDLDMDPDPEDPSQEQPLRPDARSEDSFDARVQNEPKGSLEPTQATQLTQEDIEVAVAGVGGTGLAAGLEQFLKSSHPARWRQKAILASGTRSTRGTNPSAPSNQSMLSHPYTSAPMLSSRLQLDINATPALVPNASGSETTHSTGIVPGSVASERSIPRAMTPPYPSYETGLVETQLASPPRQAPRRQFPPRRTDPIPQPPVIVSETTAPHSRPSVVPGSVDSERSIPQPVESEPRSLSLSFVDLAYQNRLIPVTVSTNNTITEPAASPPVMSDAPQRRASPQIIGATDVQVLEATGPVFSPIHLSALKTPPAHSHSRSSQPTQSSSVVPGSVASERSVAAIVRPSDANVDSITRDEEREEVPDSTAEQERGGDGHMRDADIGGSSQPVPLALLFAARRAKEKTSFGPPRQPSPKTTYKNRPPIARVVEGEDDHGNEKDAPRQPKRALSEEAESDEEIALPIAKKKKRNAVRKPRAEESEDIPIDSPVRTHARPSKKSKCLSPIEPFPGEESLESPDEGDLEEDEDEDPESQQLLQKLLQRARSATVEEVVVGHSNAESGPRRLRKGELSMEAISDTGRYDPSSGSSWAPIRSAQKRVRKRSLSEKMKARVDEATISSDEAEDFSGSYYDSQPGLPIRRHEPAATRLKARALAPAASKSTVHMPPPQLRVNKRRFVVDSEEETQSHSPRKRPRLGEDIRIPSVFAIYRADKSYYAADVTGSLGGGGARAKYSVVYADDSTEEVNLAGLRPGPSSLERGDDVMIKRARWVSASVVRAEPRGLWVCVGDASTEELVAYEDVRRSKAQAGAATLTAEEVVAMIVEREEDETQARTLAPMPDIDHPHRAASVAGTDTEDRGRLEVVQHEASQKLQGLAFVVTCAPSKIGPWRDALPAQLRIAGGTVISDWTDVASFGSLQNGRWHARADDLKVHSHAASADKRVFLLTNTPTMTPKYLIALALGIPCVSAQWAIDILDGEAEVEDWPSYLLCAGTAYHLDAHISQTLSLDSEGRSLSVRTALQQRASRRQPFARKNVLCVGNALFPTQQSGFEQQQCIPPICLAMGAARVDAVPSFPSAISSGRRYDIIIVQDGLASAATGDVRSRLDAQWVGNPTWVKQCLVMGMLLRPPRELNAA